MAHESENEVLGQKLDDIEQYQIVESKKWDKR